MNLQTVNNSEPDVKQYGQIRATYCLVLLLISSFTAGCLESNNTDVNVDFLSEYSDEIRDPTLTSISVWSLMNGSAAVDISKSVNASSSVPALFESVFAVRNHVLQVCR